MSRIIYEIDADLRLAPTLKRKLAHFKTDKAVRKAVKNLSHTFYNYRLLTLFLYFLH